MSLPQVFVAARGYLIVNQNERETLIRVCRDITAYSKKIIPPEKSVDEKLFAQLYSHFEVVAQRLAQIHLIYSKSVHFADYKGSISNAVEELIECLTFGFYLLNDTMLTYAGVVNITRYLVSSYDSAESTINREYLESTLHYLLGSDKSRLSEIVLCSEISFIYEGDYYMGLFDFSGEVMRYSITHMTLSNDPNSSISPIALKNVKILKELHRNFLILFNQYPSLSINRGIITVNHGKSTIDTKMTTLQRSVEKVESMICDICIRGQENI